MQDHNYNVVSEGVYYANLCFLLGEDMLIVLHAHECYHLKQLIDLMTHPQDWEDQHSIKMQWLDSGFHSPSYPNRDA